MRKRGTTMKNDRKETLFWLCMTALVIIAGSAISTFAMVFLAING